MGGLHGGRLFYVRPASLSGNEVSTTHAVVGEFSDYRRQMKGIAAIKRATRYHVVVLTPFSTLIR